MLIQHLPQHKVATSRFHSRHEGPDTKTLELREVRPHVPLEMFLAAASKSAFVFVVPKGYTTFIKSFRKS